MPYDNVPDQNPSAETLRLQQELDKAQRSLEVTQTQNLKLGQAIETLAAQNRKDGDIDKIAYTKNVLGIREYQEREGDSMSGYAKEIAASIERINTENRKISKANQRASLKQLDQLDQLTETVRDDDERQSLRKFIDDTRRSVNQNTDSLGVMVSRFTDNMDYISAGITSLFSDSPMLSLGVGFIANSIKNALSEKQEAKYAIQEARERQLSEELSNQIGQEKALEDIKNKLEKSLNKPVPEVVPPPVELPEVPVVVGNDEDSFTNMWLEGIHDFLDDLTMETMSISQAVNRMTGLDMEPVKLETDGIISAIDSVGEMIRPLTFGLEERRREEGVYRNQLIEAIESIPVLVDSDGKEKEDGSMLGGIGATLLAGGGLGGVVSGIMEPLLASGKSLLKKALSGIVKAFPKLLGKIFLPAAIIGALFDGVTEAIDMYNDTGSMKDAAIGFFGGILDFMTFGFFGTDELNSVLGVIGEYTEPLYDIMIKPFQFIYNKAEQALSMFDEMELPSLSDLPELIREKYEWVRDSIMGHITTPFEMIGDMMDGVFDGMKEQIRSVANSLPDFMVPDKVIDWLDTPTKPIELTPVAEKGNLSERFAGSMEAQQREKLTEQIIKTNDELVNAKDEGSQERGNVNVVDNSSRVVNNITKGNLTVHDPDMALRFRYGSFGF